MQELGAVEGIFVEVPGDIVEMTGLLLVEKEGGEGLVGAKARVQVDPFGNLFLEGAEKTDGGSARRFPWLDAPLDKPAEAPPVGIKILWWSDSPRLAPAKSDLLSRPEILRILIVLRQAVPEVPIPARCLDIVVANVPGIGVDRFPVLAHGRAGIRISPHSPAVDEGERPTPHRVDQHPVALDPAGRLGDIEQSVQEDRAVGIVIPLLPVTEIRQAAPDAVEPGASRPGLWRAGKELQRQGYPAAVAVGMVVG